MKKASGSVHLLKTSSYSLYNAIKVPFIFRLSTSFNPILPQIPISIPRPPQKAEVLKVVQGQSTGQSMDVGSTYVLALYDYTPHEQSPNEFPELELPFKEGDLLKVCGLKL